jgi:hypothetical protein
VHRAAGRRQDDRLSSFRPVLNAIATPVAIKVGSTARCPAVFVLREGFMCIGAALCRLLWKVGSDVNSCGFCKGN